MFDYLEPPGYSVPECPRCGEQCEIYYFNENRAITGCENCIGDTEAFYSRDAWEVQEERRGGW